MKTLLPLFSRPSRYLGSEWGAVAKDPAGMRLNVGLAFPDIYEVAMSYLGQKILYSLVNARGDFFAQRVFSPSLDVAALLAEQNERLATLEADTPLAELDVLAFSVTHELCYTNILQMLDLGGIPLRSAERDASHPLVLAGGGCAPNAEPLAPFVDLFVVGEAEAVLLDLLDAAAEAREGSVSRRETLMRLKDLPGVYVPEFFEVDGEGAVRPLVPGYDQVGKAVVDDLASAAPPSRQVVPFCQPVHDRLSLEIARGCTRGCRFCHAGMVYRPARERDPREVAAMLETGLAETGFEETSFLSLSTGDYSALEGLFADCFERCAAEQVSISLPSLRVGSLSPTVLELMSRIRRTGATLAPEAGSQRLRNVINKGVTEQGLCDHAAMLFSRGWQQIKLYFMIGLPTETEADLEAIFDLCAKVAAAAPPKTKRLQVTAAVSPFVPKPHTPFQWERMISPDEIRERIALLRDRFKTHKKLKLRWHEPEMSFLEGVFSRAGRELAPVVERAYRRGALFTSWTDSLALPTWLECLDAEGIDPLACLAERDENAPLPWDHLNPGVSKRFLRTERKRALEEKTTEDCRYGACRVCGVCDCEGAPSTLARRGGATPLRPKVVNPARDQQAPEQAKQTNQAADAPPKLREALGVKAGHYRVWYEKTGPARFLSTLEMQRVVERGLRRANVAATFSRGYHPSPLISFGNALPVGVASRGEWFNLFTREAYEPGELHDRLLGRFPDGLAVTRVEPLSMGRRQPQPVAESFRLEYLGGESGRESWRAAWEAFAAAKTHPFVRETRKGVRELDARSFVSQIGFAPDGALELTFDWREKYVSPLALVEAVQPDVSPVEWLLTKTAQHFE